VAKASASAMASGSRDQIPGFNAADGRRDGANETEV
jgi:hypothetical protein